MWLNRLMTDNFLLSTSPFIGTAAVQPSHCEWQSDGQEWRRNTAGINKNFIISHYFQRWVLVASFSDSSGSTSARERNADYFPQTWVFLNKEIWDNRDKHTDSHPRNTKTWLFHLQQHILNVPVFINTNSINSLRTRLWGFDSRGINETGKYFIIYSRWYSWEQGNDRDECAGCQRQIGHVPLPPCWLLHSGADWPL